MSPIIGIIDSQKSGHLVTGAYELIQTQRLGSNATTVTFSSIPQTYAHLELRLTTQQVYGGSDTGVMTFKFNGSTSTYAWHPMWTNGSYLNSSASSSLSNGYLADSVIGSSNSGYYGFTVASILDYTSTVKNKVMRGLGGGFGPGANELHAFSTAWFTTPAINSIAITGNNGDFYAGCRFSLYGIKGS